MMHMSDDIPVPSVDNPRVPPALDKVVRTALAKKKADRFSNMRDMHRALAQSRNDVQDTPAPVMKTDPQMPAILVGVDELGRSSGAAPVRAAGATPAPAANDAFASEDALAIQPRWRTRRFVVGAAIVLGAVVGLALALRHPEPASESARAAAPAPAAAVPPVAPPPTREAAAPVTAQAAPIPTAADAAEPTTTGAKTNAGGKATTVKASKSHHRSVRRKDPVKW